MRQENADETQPLVDWFGFDARSCSRRVGLRRAGTARPRRGQRRACTVDGSSDYATVYPTTFAPEPIPEFRPAPPGYGYNWVDGYWDWTGYDWTWSSGYWVPERVGLRLHRAPLRLRRRTAGLLPRLLAGRQRLPRVRLRRLAGRAAGRLAWPAAGRADGLALAARSHAAGAAPRPRARHRPAGGWRGGAAAPPPASRLPRNAPRPRPLRRPRAAGAVARRLVRRPRLVPNAAARRKWVAWRDCWRRVHRRLRRPRCLGAATRAGTAVARPPRPGRRVPLPVRQSPAAGMRARGPGATLLRRRRRREVRQPGMAPGGWRALRRRAETHRRDTAARRPASGGLPPGQSAGGIGARPHGRRAARLPVARRGGAPPAMGGGNASTGPRAPARVAAPARPWAAATPTAAATRWAPRRAAPAWPRRAAAAPHRRRCARPRPPRAATRSNPRFRFD